MIPFHYPASRGYRNRTDRMGGYESPSAPCLSAALVPGGLELTHPMTGFNWIIVSQLFLRIPTEPAAPSKYSLPFFMSQPTRLISLRTKVASLCTALLSHQHRWPCELPGGLIPCGQALRRCWYCDRRSLSLCMIPYQLDSANRRGMW
jgi:hypothetical protein